MATTTRKLAVVVEEFTAGSPSQQLLDRFLIGYPSDGTFHRPTWQISVALPGTPAPAEVQRRVRDFGLATAADPAAAVRDAQAVLVIWRGPGHQPNDALLDTVLAASVPASRVFVHGVLASSEDRAQQALATAARKNIQLVAGSPLPVTWRFPEVDLPRNARVQESIVVVQGPPGVAEWHALECLLPVVERRRKGEAGVRSIRRVSGNEVWNAADRGEWSWNLLAAALSRSDTPQGNSVTDGRTQDLVGLGVIPRLVQSPRAWLLVHHDGLNSALLVLDGAVADYNFAIRLNDGAVVSAQIHRPPPPGDHQYSRLAAVLDPFFASGIAPWQAARSLFTAHLMRLMADQRD